MGRYKDWDEGIEELQVGVHKKEAFVARMQVSKLAKRDKLVQAAKKSHVSRQLNSWWKSRQEDLCWYSFSLSRKRLKAWGIEDIRRRYESIQKKFPDQLGSMVWHDVLGRGFVQVASSMLCAKRIKTSFGASTGMKVDRRFLAPDLMELLGNAGIWVNSNFRVEEEEVARFVPKVRKNS